MTLKNWISVNKLKCKIDENIVIVPSFGKLLLVEPKNGILINKDYRIELSEAEEDILEGDKEIKYLLFNFGSRYYYCPLKTSKNDYNEIVYEPEFIDFLNIGEYEKEYEIDFVNLGVHTGYELLNGSGEPENWVAKSKFYKQSALGTIDKNTLAGTLALQLACDKKGLKSIIGYTATIAYDYSPDKELQDTFEVILYVKNEQGWKNLLYINKAILVDNDGFCPEERLLELSEGLYCVFSKESYFSFYINKSKRMMEFIDKYATAFGDNSLYYQLDFTEMSDDTTDILQLQKAKKYFEVYSDILPAVYIPDAYYVERIDFKIKEYLNGIDRNTKPHSEAQFLKDLTDIFTETETIFETEEYFEKFVSSLTNTKVIADNCNFKIEIGNPKIPKFEFVEDAEEFYFEKLSEGFKKKVLAKYDDEETIQKYMDRLDEENSVIVGAGFVDYFLILWDVIDFCKKEGILVGVGRGSVGGSLVAYLLDIIEIDPLQYNLLFERFLNKTRVMPEEKYEMKCKNSCSYLIPKEIFDEKYPFLEIGFEFGAEIQNELHEFLKLGDDKVNKGYNIKSLELKKVARKDSLPDIDLDFEASRRQEVKRYLERRYSLDHVCSIGTYNRMKVKSAIKDFARVKKLPFDKVNYATKDIPDAIRSYWHDIIENAVKKNQLKSFVMENAELCELLRPSMNQPKSASIHASAVLIFPKFDKDGNPMTVYDWLPVKKVDGVLVSEWEGKYVDMAGFLKEDILGLSQLDKFKMILSNIKINKGKKVNLNKIPMSVPEVFDYFQNGWTEDVFQFGGGLKSYSKQAKPETVEDLTAMNALYRPGPMESGSHTNFALIKNGKKKAEFDKGMKKITKATHGLYVYQEQIMQAMVVGGLTLVQSDEVRTIMKKKDFEAMSVFKTKFMEHYGQIVGSQEDAEKTWDKLFSFSSYGFNKSHSAAYSIMSYWSQYFKVRYPLEFWTASLNFAREDDDSIPNRLSEMEAIKDGIQVKQPNINRSDIFFTCNPDTNEIYWSLSKVKGAGDVAITMILKVRGETGEFFDLDDFLSKTPKNKVNRKVVTNLILAGAFDEIGGMHGLPIQKPSERLQILEYYYGKIKAELPKDVIESPYKGRDWFWILKQKEITGLGSINYKQLIKKKLPISAVQKFISPESFFTHTPEDKWGDPCTIAGIISMVKTRKYKKGTMANIQVESNNTIIHVTLWDEIYQKNSTALDELLASKALVAITGVLRYDNFKGKNILMSDENSKIYKI